MIKFSENTHFGDKKISITDKLTNHLVCESVDKKIYFY
jgi:hypothetical protein